MCDVAGETAMQTFSTMIKNTIDNLRQARQVTLHPITAPCIALFRHYATSTALVRVACKLMAKKTICDRPGTYASTYQRSDAEQQFHDALVHFIESMHDCDPPLKDILSDPARPEWQTICMSYLET